jgi:polysaccharide pyruvyl transferase WcaK-like protein
MKIIQLQPRPPNVIEYGLNYLLQRAGIRFRIELAGVNKINAGDTAIAEAFRYLCKKEFPGSKVSLMNCRKIFTKADVTRINKADLLFVNGGGLFLYDSFPNLISDWQWGISENLLDRIEIPIVVYSVGFNKFRGQLDFNENFNRTVTKLIEKSSFFGLRNSGSCRAIKKYVPERLHERIKLSYCPTFLLNEAFDFRSNSRHDNSVGFVIAGDRLKNRHRHLNKYIKNMKTFVEYLRNKGLETILIEHCSGDSWISDYVRFDRFVCLAGKDSKHIYKTYSEIGAVVGDRGHSQMVPFACGCKILTPISHDKLAWFLEDVGLQEFGVEESDDDLAEKLIAKFDRLRSIDWQSIQEEKMRMIAETNKRNLEFIKEHIYKGVGRG